MKLFEQIINESRADDIRQNLEKYIGHGLSANALDGFDGQEQIILTYALEDEDAFSEAFDAAAARLDMEPDGGLWDHPGFEEAFLDELVRAGENSRSVMSWVEDELTEELDREMSAKQNEIWRAAGLDDDSLDDMGRLPGTEDDDLLWN
jgi:hypothetical protein